MIKTLNESESLKFKKISPEEKQQRGILGRLYGPLASCVVPTRNGRRYSEQLWEKVLNNDIVQELFANGGLAGELQHPAEREETDPEKIAIMMPEPPVKDKDGHLVGYVDILDTPCGRIAYQLAKYGFNFGISSRGTGDLINGPDGEEVDPDTYQLNAFDLVAVPALKDARLSFTEALDTKKYNKTLKEALDEELSQASEKDKKIMEEAIDSLKLDEKKYTRDELKDKFGTDDLDLINAGNEEDVGLDKEFYLHPDKDEDARKALWYGVQDSTKILKDALALLSHDELEDLCRKYNISTDVYGKDKLGDKDIDEAFDPHGYTNAIRAINDGVETDEDHEALKDYLEKIIHYCKSMAEDYEIELEESVSESGCSDKECEELEEDAGNSREELVSELKESILKNGKLEKDNLSLQEKLSVCTAKEKSLNEELKKYKASTASLSDTAKEVKTLKESLKRSDTIIKSSRSRITKLLESKKVIKDDLNEALNKVDALEKKVKLLNESMSNQKDELSKNKQLIEKYQRALKDSKTRYIAAKAAAHGISYDEVKSNLNESYSFKDIDSICEELSERKMNMNKLPFRITEDTRISVKPKKDHILSGVENSDDDVSDMLLNFIR